jgi:cysteine dioxygenase
MVIQRIDNLQQLSRNLNLGPGYDGYKGIMEAIHIKPDELANLWLKHSDEHQRICIYDTPGIEAIVSLWKPGQSTLIHDYNAQQAWTKILSGQLILEFFDVAQGERHAPVTETQLLNEGEFTYMNDRFGFHRFSNLGTSDAIAIHLYADKIEEWKVYNERSGEVDVVPTYYDRNV